MHLYPADFEDEESTPENDPGGLRAFYYARLREVSDVATWSLVPGPQIRLPNGDLRVAYSNQVSVESAGEFHERCLRQLTRREIARLLEIGEGYRSAVEAEFSRSKMGGVSVSQDVHSSMNLLRSKVIAGLLQRWIREVLDALDAEERPGA